MKRWISIFLILIINVTSVSTFAGEANQDWTELRDEEANSSKNSSANSKDPYGLRREVESTLGILGVLFGAALISSMNSASKSSSSSSGASSSRGSSSTSNDDILWQLEKQNKLIEKQNRELKYQDCIRLNPTTSGFECWH